MISWDYIGIMWGCLGIYWGDYGDVNVQDDDGLTSKNVGKASIHTRFSIAMFDCQRKPQICSFSLRTIPHMLHGAGTEPKASFWESTFENIPT